MSDESPTLEVEFTQTFTVYPPEWIDDEMDLEAWFHDEREAILRDVLDPYQGEAEVLHVNES